MSALMSDPAGCLTDAEFDALARGQLDADALERLRAQVQAVLDDPDAGVSHEAVWAGLEQRMKRAVRAA